MAASAQRLGLYATAAQQAVEESCKESQREFARLRQSLLERPCTAFNVGMHEPVTGEYQKHMGYFQARAVVKQATDYLAIHLYHPQADAFSSLFVQYGEATGEPPSALLLDKFMVQVGEQLKLRALKADALILYGLRCDVALLCQLPA